MSKWEKLRKSYVTCFPPTPAEEEIIPICFKEAFTAAKLGTRTLFANFKEEPIWVTKDQPVWKYVSTNEDVNQLEVRSWFPNYQQVTELDPYIRGGRFKDKNIYFSTYTSTWHYLNPHTVLYILTGWKLLNQIQKLLRMKKMKKKKGKITRTLVNLEVTQLRSKTYYSLQKHLLPPYYRNFPVGQKP